MNLDLLRVYRCIGRAEMKAKAKAKKGRVTKMPERRAWDDVWDVGVAVGGLVRGVYIAIPLSSGTLN